MQLFPIQGLTDSSLSESLASCLLSSLAKARPGPPYAPGWPKIGKAVRTHVQRPSPSNWRAKRSRDISVDLVVPVLNEAHVLRQSVHSLREFMSRHLPYRWRLVIAENGSTDGTVDVAVDLGQEFDDVHVEIIGAPGRGRALRLAWSRSTADIVGYTDVDLSTGLEALPKLLDALVNDGCDLAVGSRLAPGSRTTRSLKRELVSRCYNLLLRRLLKVEFSDAQTGFKAVTREVVDRVLPQVQDQGWFLDTELLVLGQAMGYRIADIPVTWKEDDDSRVRIIRTAWEDLCGIVRLRRSLRAFSVRERRTDGFREPVRSRQA